MPVITEIAHLKRIYRRRVPKMFYDYAESGSWSEQTFRENTTDFDKLYFRQRVAVDMTGRSTASKCSRRRRAWSTSPTSCPSARPSRPGSCGPS